MEPAGSEEDPHWECKSCGAVLRLSPVARETLDDESYQAREVFAQYGLTSYVSQVLEKAILNALTLRQVAASDAPTQEAWDRYFASNASLTMGRLIGAFERHFPSEGELVRLLRTALPKRNYIAHTFFWNYAVAFTTGTGRETMLLELFEIRELFESVQSLIEPLIRREFMRRGHSAEKLQELLDSAYAELRENLPED